EIYRLSLHDALPICDRGLRERGGRGGRPGLSPGALRLGAARGGGARGVRPVARAAAPPGGAPGRRVSAAPGARVTSAVEVDDLPDRKSTRLNSSHVK